MSNLSYNKIQTTNFYGLKISHFNKTELIKSIKYNIENKIQTIYHGYSLTSFYFFKSNPGLFQLVNNSDVFMNDGRGYYYFLKLLGVKNIDPISLPDLVFITLELANEFRYSVLLFGTKKEINSEATKLARIKFPNAKIADGIDGFFDEKNELDVLDKINEIKPDILLVGISSPKKEKFLLKYRNNLDATIIINCGGMIDVLAGKEKLHPKWITTLGLAWLYRIIQDPKRLVKTMLFDGIKALFILIPISFLKIKILHDKNFNFCKFLKLD